MPQSARDGLRPGSDRVDVDFSLAIHNLTGKYFIGRDLLTIAGLPLGDTYFWRFPRRRPPSGTMGRIIGRLQLLHIEGHAVGGPLRFLPRRRSRRPLLHLDPFTVPSTVLRREDAILCHDLGPLSHPSLFDPRVCRIYRAVYDHIARIGPHLIFVSEASRAAFELMYPNCRATSVRVIYPAIRPGGALASAQPIAAVKRPFLLTVGSLGSRKNQLRCIHAFASSGLAERGFDYVLCGAREPGFEQVEAAARATSGVSFLSYVSDSELSWLYHSAVGFVLVSELEGFGMPVAEAIARGLVPLVSRDSVLYEVAGEGSLVADPHDVDEIAARMAELASMSDDERRGRQQRLMQSLMRIDTEKIRSQWRTAFADILLGVPD